MAIEKKLLIIFIMLTMMFVGCMNIKDNSQEQEDISQEQEQQLLLNGISLTKDIIISVYRGERYTYEALLFALAVNDDENNLYKGYFPIDEGKGFIFPLDKSNEVLIQVFGEKEYPSLEDVFDYDEESDIYYKNLDFGWNTGYIAENVTANISEDKLKLYTKFELINLWYDVEGDPVPTAIADCEITYSINKSDDKIYLQFENIEIESKIEAASEYENEANNEIQDISSFIPRDWEILKQGDELAIVEGDLNKDGIIDKAFVITEKEKNNSSDYIAQRNLIIVFGNSDGSYDLSITAKNAILHANEGGTFGDPFDGIAIDRGSVLLKFMGGSSRWSRYFRFRYQDSGWYLIGFTENAYESVGDSMVVLQDDYNLITGDYIGDELNNGKIITVEKNIGKKQLLNLNDFIANEYSVQ